MTSRAPRLVALWVGLAIAAPSATSRAAEPTKAECLDASEAWLAQRKAGKLREARGKLLVCAAESCPKDVREECAQHVAEISAAIPTVVFEVKDASGQDVSAVKVTIDGAPLVDRLDGTAIPLDPGDHRFTFVAEGLPPAEKTLAVHEGEKGRLERIDLTARAEALGHPAAPPAVPPATTADEPSGTPGGAQRAIGLVVGGAGVAGIAVGAIFGAVAQSKWSQAKTNCGTGCGPDAPAQQEKNEAQSAASTATVAFIAGGVAMGIGAVVWLTARRAAGPVTELTLVPAFGAGLEGLTLRGAF
jgi:hypothetical protein